MKITHLLSSVLLSLSLTVHVHAEDKPPILEDKIDTYLEYLVTEDFSGSVLVVHDGEKVISKGFGLSDRANRYPNNPNTVFDIMSVTKQFTGAAILKLQMDNKLKVTDTLAKFFPAMPEDKRDITLHQLLTHTAGLIDLVGGDYDEITQKEYLQAIYDSKLRFQPGSHYAYANAGYSLLAMVVEKASGLSYEAYLQKALFKPAGMKQTGYILPEFKAMDVAVGYGVSNWGRPNEKPWQTDGPYWHLRGNGGILSTTEDMYLWYQALRGEAILTKDAKAQYFRAEKKPRFRQNRNSTYAYGWSIDKAPWDDLIINHTGGNPAMFSDVAFYINTNSAIIILSNIRDGFSAEVSREIESIMFVPDHKPAEKKSYRSIGKWLDEGLTAERIINRIKANGPELDKYMIDDGELNRLGYFYVQNKQLKDALAVFLLNTQRNPNIANTHDSYGETLIADGQFQAGVAAYQKALDVDPNYENAEYAREMLAKYGSTDL